MQPEVVAGSLLVIEIGAGQEVAREFFHAGGAALRTEYEAIADAGFLVQIDDPFLSENFADPKLDPNAERYDRLPYMDVGNRDLRVMDLTAITFCKEINLPILVFDLMRPGNLGRALAGEEIGTLIG